MHIKDIFRCLDKTCKNVTKYLTYFIIRSTHVIHYVIYSKVTQGINFVLLKIYIKSFNIEYNNAKLLKEYLKLISESSSSRG